MWPYRNNPIRETLGRTRNWDDSLNIFNDSHGPEGDYNPIFKVEKLGAIIDQGFGAFITMVGVSFWSCLLRKVNLHSFRASIRALHTVTFGKASGVAFFTRLR
jgi:hypothetical protein